MTIREIIERCKRGDRLAFSFLVDRHSERAFSVAFRILNDTMEAEDVVQESFIAVWEKITDFDPERSFPAWLYRVVVNRAYDALRKKKRQKETDLENIGELIDSADNPGVILDNRETGQLIRALTEELSPIQKLVFVLIELEECTHDEAAEITGMNKDAIKSNLNHARKNIAKRLESIYHESRTGKI